MGPERSRVDLAKYGQERYPQLDQYVAGHAFGPQETRTPQCRTRRQTRESQREGSKSINGRPQPFDGIDDIRLVPRWHQREVHVGARHKANAVGFERSHKLGSSRVIPGVSFSPTKTRVGRAFSFVRPPSSASVAAPVIAALSQRATSRYGRQRLTCSSLNT